LPATALALCLAFAVVALGGRTWLQYRRTGDHGFRGLSGRAGSAEWWGGVLLTAGAVLMTAAPLLALLGVVEMPNPRHPAIANAAGLAFALAGLALTVAAQLQMGASWRIGVRANERTALVTDGLFSFVRNPIFTGLLLFATGILLLVPGLAAALALAMLLLAIELQVRRVEEPYLVRSHGDRYRDYARRVGRFVPGLGRRA
jgi:protein-S-isoprenylcysteine O-methyltransferase Ste14